MPPGRSDLSECDQVAAPTVSITASTRSGSRAPDSNAASAPSSTARSPLGLVAAGDPTRSPAAAAEHDQRGRHPAAGALHQHGVAGRTPDWVKSIRYAVSQAVGRQAASSNDSSAGLGTRLRRGTTTCSASVPW